MNGFLFSLIIVGGVLLLMIIVHILWLFGCGIIFRDNYVFKNKYERKIHFLNKKIEKYKDKIGEKISNTKENIDYLKSKSIYCENMKILHEKDLNCTILMKSEDFMAITKKKGK